MPTKRTFSSRKEPKRKQSDIRHLEDTYEKLINQVSTEAPSSSVPNDSIPADVNQNPTNVLPSNNASERPVYPIYDDSAAVQINIWKLLSDLNE